MVRIFSCACFIFILFVLCYYKSYCTMLKYKIMINQLIKPRKFPSFNSEAIHLLFCNNSIVPPTAFRHNHYVPLIFCSEKNKVNKKHKMVTLQKCKGSKNMLLILYIIFGSKTYLQIIICPILLMI